MFADVGFSVCLPLLTNALILIVLVTLGAILNFVWDLWEKFHDVFDAYLPRRKIYGITQLPAYGPRHVTFR